MNESIEALWTVVFRTPQGSQGAGIAVIDNGRIYGGDSVFYYLGHVESHDQQIAAKVHVRYYGNGYRLFPAAGDSYEVEMTGVRNDEKTILLNGRISGHPQSQLNLVLTRREALP